MEAASPLGLEYSNIHQGLPHQPQQQGVDLDPRWQYKMYSLQIHWKLQLPERLTDFHGRGHRPKPSSGPFLHCFPWGLVSDQTGQPREVVTCL